MKPFTTIAVILLAFIATIHALRVIRGAELVLNGMAVPIWVSAVAALVAGGLTVMVWRESQQRG
jgi:hypothetical protein